MAYYVIDDKLCKGEGMTKEQILTAITEAVETHAITDVDTGFVTTLKETNANRGVTVWVGSTAEYAAIPLKKQNCLYIITDDEGSNDYAGFIDHLNVTLWTGMAGEDDVLTIPGIHDYTLFAITINSGEGAAAMSSVVLLASPAVVTASGTKILRAAWHVPNTLIGTYSGPQYFFAGVIDADADTLTIKKAQTWTYEAGYNGTTSTVGAHVFKIVGIM